MGYFDSVTVSKLDLDELFQACAEVRHVFTLEEPWDGKVTLKNAAELVRELHSSLLVMRAGAAVIAKDLEELCRMVDAQGEAIREFGVQLDLRDLEKKTDEGRS